MGVVYCKQRLQLEANSSYAWHQTWTGCLSKGMCIIVCHRKNSALDQMGMLLQNGRSDLNCWVGKHCVQTWTAAICVLWSFVGREILELESDNWVTEWVRLLSSSLFATQSIFSFLGQRQWGKDVTAGLSCFLRQEGKRKTKWKRERERERHLWRRWCYMFRHKVGCLCTELGPTRAGHFRCFWIFSIIKNEFLAFFFKLIIYFCTSPI